MEINKELIKLYKEIAALTSPYCALHCALPYSCCDHIYCQLAISNAKDNWNTTDFEIKAIRDQADTVNFPKLLFMTKSGCICPEHFRIACSIHSCSVASIGVLQKRRNPGDRWSTITDKEDTDKYWELRNRIEALEWQKYLLLHPEEKENNPLDLEIPRY